MIYGTIDRQEAPGARLLHQASGLDNRLIYNQSKAGFDARIVAADPTVIQNTWGPSVL